MIKKTTNIRILYSHTDQMGYVYYGNYAMFYEIGRSEFLREFGLSYASMEENGIMMPVIEMTSNYHKPLFYDEIVEIKTILKELPTASITFSHEFLNSKGELCHTGNVRLGFINKESKRAVRVPAYLLQCLTDSFNKN